jgi:hypothetical protein
MIAHGGTGGLIVESVLVVSIAAVLLAVWVRSRGAGEDSDE